MRWFANEQTTKNKRAKAQKGGNLENYQTDEDLLEKIKNGDEMAEIELLSRYKDLVVKISRGYFIVGGDLEDLVQEGMIGLYKAIKNYSGDKETSFKTFAVLCIKHQIQTAIKMANTNKNKPLSSAVSFQSFTENGSNESLDFLPIELVLEDTPAEKAIDKENFKNLHKTIKSSLSPLEYKVLKLYLQGYSYKEISSILNVSSKSIDNSLSRIRLKLKTKLKNAS
jgi:RNA polymerase sporulation-specific sigma factor